MFIPIFGCRLIPVLLQHTRFLIWEQNTSQKRSAAPKADKKCTVMCQQQFSCNVVFVVDGSHSSLFIRKGNPQNWCARYLTTLGCPRSNCHSSQAYWTTWGWNHIWVSTLEPAVIWSVTEFLSHISPYPCSLLLDSAHDCFDYRYLSIQLIRCPPIPLYPPWRLPPRIEAMPQPSDPLSEGTCVSLSCLDLELAMVCHRASTCAFTCRHCQLHDPNSPWIRWIYQHVYYD